MMSQDDAEILAAARAGFLEEARELMQQFEAALLVMEENPADAENLNAAFRAAHTIKGTAGLFGCNAVAAFTHEVETLMEGLRSGELEVSEPISATLLESLDQVGALLAEVNLEQGSPEVAERSEALAARLRALHGHGPSAAGPAAGRGNADVPGDADPAPQGSPLWHLSLRFGPDALRNGLDPLAFLRYLGTVARVDTIRTLADEVPALEALDAESCCLGFELRLDTRAHPQTRRETIEQVFEFAVDDARIDLLEPGAAPARWAALLDERSAGDAARSASLLALWADMGVSLALRPAAQAQPAPDDGEPADAQGSASQAPLATPNAGAVAIERRLGGADAAADRRQNEPERRDGQRDRRAGEETRFIRVRADKLDRLIDTIGELVIAGSGAQSAALREQSAGFMEAAQRVCDLVEEARDGALALRMVPIGETFARFHRVVRDVGKQLGKEVELQVSGGDTELDKSMVETIADPLMHLVRNSLDHGIEPPAEREAAGKPARGQLALHAYHEGGSVVIEVSDDGRGLVRDRILGKAVQRGLIAAEAVLSDAEVWQLIFLPGFSTAEVVTNVSGRGVGMDVVKRNIEALRGQISIVSTAGAGTTMQIRLPLTLAIIDGFLTQVGRVHYVMPLSVVAECIDLPAECRTAQLANVARDPVVTGTFDLRGEVLPWLDLAAYYGHGPEADAATATTDAAAGAAAPRSSRRSLIVVRFGTQRIGVVVDRLLGEHQTVIKPLAGIFKHLRSLAGSTILGSGDVALVLDMQGLVATAIDAARQRRPTPPHATRSPDAAGRLKAHP